MRISLGRPGAFKRCIQGSASQSGGPWGHVGGILGPSWCLMGFAWENLRAFLGPSGILLNFNVWQVQKSFCSFSVSLISGPCLSWGCLGPVGAAYLGATFAHPGLSWGCLSFSLSDLGPLGAVLGVVWCHPEAVQLRAILGHIRPLWVPNRLPRLPRLPSLPRLPRLPSLTKHS